MSSPRRQGPHSPQVMNGWTITVSPTCDVGDGRADLVDPAGVLVARRVRELDAATSRPTGPPGCAGRSGTARRRRSARSRRAARATLGSSTSSSLRARGRRAVWRRSCQDLLGIVDCHAAADLQQRTADAAVDVETQSAPAGPCAASGSARRRRPARRSAARTPASRVVRAGPAGRRNSTQRRASGTSGRSATRRRRDLLRRGAVGQQRLAQPRLASEEGLALEQLAQGVEIVVVGFARERSGEAVPAAERRR